MVIWKVNQFPSIALIAYGFIGNSPAASTSETGMLRSFIVLSITIHEYGAETTAGSAEPAEAAILCWVDVGIGLLRTGVRIKQRHAIVSIRHHPPRQALRRNRKPIRRRTTVRPR